MIVNVLVIVVFIDRSLWWCNSKVMLLFSDCWMCVCLFRLKVMFLQVCMLICWWNLVLIWLSCSSFCLQVVMVMLGSVWVCNMQWVFLCVMCMVLWMVKLVMLQLVLFDIMWFCRFIISRLLVCILLNISLKGLMRKWFFLGVVLFVCGSCIEKCVQSVLFQLNSVVSWYVVVRLWCRISLLGVVVILGI